MSVQSQESVVQEECMTRLELLESSIDETEDRISLLNAQVSNIKYREVFSVDTKQWLQTQSMSK